MDKPVVTNHEFLRSALVGMHSVQKTLDSKWFYDAAGSELFERITELSEYYPTRTEIGILRDNAKLLATYIPQGSVLLELGSGSSVKTRLLLDEAADLAAYSPLDISAAFLAEVAKGIAKDYPSLQVSPIVGDFTSAIMMPEEIANLPKTVFFPGSTIGNLTQTDAVMLLRRLSDLPGVGAIILGADLVKDVEILLAAYDDASGVTAAFNRNILRHLIRETGAVLDPDAFEHQARWNSEKNRIEMHLISNLSQLICLGGEEFWIERGESIHTENSHKYSSTTLTEMARLAGWKMPEFLTDDGELFSVSVLTPA